MEKVIKCAIYPRKSKQNDNSESMEVQIQMCKDYIAQNYTNYTITIYDKDYGVTGHSIKVRKDFQRMMKDVNDGKINLVAIQRYDRISRNTRDFCNLYHDMEKVGCELVSVSQKIDTSTPYGKKFMYDLASTAELEWALNSERHKDVNKYARMRGKCNLSPYALPFGYKAEIIDGTRRMVIDREKEPIVRDAIEYYKKYQSKVATTRYINEKYGLILSHSFMQGLTKSEFYIGKYRENENYCEPYMSKEELEELKIIESRKNRFPIGKRNIFLFSGLLICPKCGKKMESQSQVQKSGWRYHYYRCYNIYRTGKCDFSGNINERYIESYLLDNMEELSKRYEEYTKYQLENTKTEVVDVSKYKKELERLTNAYIKGRIKEEYYDSEYERLTSIITDSEGNNLLQFKKYNEQDFSYIITDEWKEQYQSLDRTEKRSIWQNLVKKIEFNEDKTIKMVHFL